MCEEGDYEEENKHCSCWNRVYVLNGYRLSTLTSVDQNWWQQTGSYEFQDQDRVSEHKGKPSVAQCDNQSDEIGLILIGKNGLVKLFPFLTVFVFFIIAKLNEGILKSVSLNSVLDIVVLKVLQYHTNLISFQDGYVVDHSFLVGEVLVVYKNIRKDSL